MIQKQLKARKISRKYPLQEDFFDVINTEEKAYFLGLLYADGYNNTKRNSINLGLKESDKLILEKLNDLVQPTKPLQYINHSNQRLLGGISKNTSNQYRLVMCSKHISNRLIDLGCMRSKTFSLKFPVDSQVPNNLIHHFVRGYFDGDGYVSKGKREEFSITGTVSFLTDLQELLYNTIGFSKTKFNTRFPERNNNITSLVSCGRKKAISFREWLYKDATIFLERKKITFDSY